MEVTPGKHCPAPGTPPGKPRGALRRHPVITVLAAAVAAAAIAVVIVAASGGPGTITLHGTQEVAGSVLTSGENYPDIDSGTQVTVTDASGKVIGTGELQYDSKATNTWAKKMGDLGEWGAETFYN